jgi:hypothetical protein
MTYERLVPIISSETHVPRVFGFKIHSSSASLPKNLINSNKNEECKNISNNNSKISNSINNSSNNEVGSSIKDTNVNGENAISLAFINKIVSDNNISAKKRKL